MVRRMFDQIEQKRGGEGHFGRLELRQEQDVCSMRTITSLSERVKHATRICRRRAASEALKKIGFYKHSAPTEPRRGARKASQLRQERDVCSLATNRSISERVKHATEVCRRQAASEDLKKIGFYKHSAPTEPRRRARKASQLRQERDVCSMATNRPTSERVEHATDLVVGKPPPEFGMSGYGQASLTALLWGKPERNLMIGFYKHSAPTEPRRRSRKASQLRQERNVCRMATKRSISERVQHATGICRRRAASEALEKIGFYKHSAPTEPRRKTRHVGGKPTPVFGMGGYGQASLTALRWGKPERMPNDRALQTFGSYGAKTASTPERQENSPLPEREQRRCSTPSGSGIISGSYPRVAACRPYPRLYSLSPSGTSEGSTQTFSDISCISWAVSEGKEPSRYRSRF